MKHLIYAVYDLKALTIVDGLVQTFPSDGAAARMFTYLILRPGDPNSQFAQYPNDFVLVRIGNIDSDTLAVESYGVGVSDPVLTGTAVIRSSQSDQPAVSMSVANDASSGEPVGSHV